jgi:hypothetical protein
MGLFFAWAAGEGIIAWRWAKAKAPPTPGSLLLPTALYLSLAILAEYQPARATATVFAWAVDLAILMQVVGKVPAQQTGWPPPELAATVIWPGGASANASGSTSASTSKPSAASTAENAASRSSQIIHDITQLPGFGAIT